MHKQTTRLATSAVALMAFSALAPMAAAQQLEEITVTARKVEENLMQVPLAITAFTAADIEAKNVKQMTELVGSTPSFHFVNQTGGGSGRNDRGFNSLTFRALFSPSNGGTTAGGLLFVDGAPVLNSNAPSLTDIERIEVLKGPQSAYFGRSTFAGAINFVTRDPSMTELKGKVSAEVSSYDSTEEQLSVEGPLVQDKVGIRVSGRYYKRGGMYVNAANTSEKLGGQSTKSISAQLVAQPSDALKIKAFGEVFEDNDGPPMHMALKNAQMSCFAGGRAVPARSNNYICGALPDYDQYSDSLISSNYVLDKTAYDVLINNTTNKPVIFDPHFLQHGGLRRQDVQADVKIDYDFADGHTLTSLSAYHRDKVMNILDLSFRDGSTTPNTFFGVFGGFPYVRWQLVTQSLGRDYSQEVRITSPQKQRLRYSAGVNYINLFSPGGTVYGLGALAPGGVGFFSAITQNKVKTPSVFGALYFDLAELLTLSAEARYQWDQITQQVKIASTGLPPVGAGANPLSNTFKSFSPRVSLDYKFAPDSTVYALWSRGYRPGGFNAVLYSSPATVVAQFAAFGALPAYKEEKLDNFEAGIKASLWENRARVTLTAYYDKYANGQVSNTIPFNNPDGSLNLASAVVNTGKIDLKGLEFEGQIQATAHLKFTAAAALNDTNIKVFLSSDGTQVTGNPNVAGNKTPTAPRWTGSLSAEYSDRLTDRLEWYGRVDYNYIGRTFTDFSNVAWNPARNLVSARIGVKTENASLELFGTNLLNDKHSPSSFLGNDLFTGAGTNEIRYGLPVKQQFGARVRYSF